MADGRAERRSHSSAGAEEIDGDDESKQRLEESQRKLLSHNLARAAKDLKETVWRSYRHIHLLGKDNSHRAVHWAISRLHAKMLK